MVSRIGLIVGLAAALALGGCGGGGSLGPLSAVIGPEGGIFDFNGIVLDVPPGAVAAPVTVVVTPLAPLSATPLPLEAPAGLTAVAAARLDPAEMLFALPVTVTFPLSVTLTAGQKIAVYWIHNNAWEDTTWQATVSANGKSAWVQIDRLRVYALFVD